MPPCETAKQDHALLDSNGCPFRSRTGYESRVVLVKPADFDSTGYPLLFLVFGGPGNSEVEDNWGGYYLWHSLFTQRGSGRQGRQPGYPGSPRASLAPGDQRTDGRGGNSRPGPAAHALAQRNYVDAGRIGIWGWSYGGFMSLNSLSAPRYLQDRGSGVPGDALGPVRQRVYRAIMADRDNKAGYDRGSPHQLCEGLRGNLLLVHGGGDDNVHFQTVRC